MSKYLLALVSVAAVSVIAYQHSAHVVSPTAERFASFKPVADAMLEHPDPADWINWRRTLDGWGYSPLAQINRQNVHDLRLVWSHPLAPGVGEATPLVHDGIMYIVKPMIKTGAGGVLALDAASGALIWEYQKDLDF